MATPQKTLVISDLKRLQALRENLVLVRAFLDGVHSQCSYSEGSTQQEMYIKLGNAFHVIDRWIKELKEAEEHE